MFGRNTEIPRHRVPLRRRFSLWGSRPESVHPSLFPLYVLLLTSVPIFTWVSGIEEMYTCELPGDNILLIMRMALLFKVIALKTLDR